MGQKDLAAKDLESKPDVFADIINAFVYDGEPVMRLLYALTGEWEFINSIGELAEKQEKGDDVTMCEVVDKFVARGIQQGIQRAILELLEELGNVPQQITERIRAEDNPDVLSRWHKSAAKSDSIVEFEMNM